MSNDDSESFGPRMPTQDELEQVNTPKPSSYDPEKAKKDWEAARNEQPQQKQERDSWMVELPPQLGSSLNFGAT